MTKGVIKGIYEVEKQGNIQAKLFILLCVSYGGEQVLEWIKGSDWYDDWWNYGKNYWKQK